MARDLNKVMLIGRLGKDPETRFFPDGSQLTTLSVATGNTYKDKQGQRQQKTQWHSHQGLRKDGGICPAVPEQGQQALRGR